MRTFKKTEDIITFRFVMVMYSGKIRAGDWDLNQVSHQSLRSLTRKTMKPRLIQFRPEN